MASNQNQLVLRPSWKNVPRCWNAGGQHSGQPACDRPAKFFTVSLPLKKGGNGRRAFLIGFRWPFQGRAVKLREGNHVMNVRRGYGLVGMCGVYENLTPIWMLPVTWIRWGIKTLEAELAVKSRPEELWLSCTLWILFKDRQRFGWCFQKKYRKLRMQLGGRCKITVWFFLRFVLKIWEHYLFDPVWVIGLKSAPIRPVEYRGRTPWVARWHPCSYQTSAGGSVNSCKL